MAKRTFKKSGTRDVGTLGSNFKNVPLLPQEAFAAPPPQDGAGGTGRFNTPGQKGADYGTKEHLDSAFGDTTTSFDLGGRADPRGVGGNIPAGAEKWEEPTQESKDKEQSRIDTLNELETTGQDLANQGMPPSMTDQGTWAGSNVLQNEEGLANTTKNPYYLATKDKYGNYGKHFELSLTDAEADVYHSEYKKSGKGANMPKTPGQGNLNFADRKTWLDPTFGTGNPGKTTITNVKKDPKLVSKSNPKGYVYDEYGNTIPTGTKTVEWFGLPTMASKWAQETKDSNPLFSGPPTRNTYDQREWFPVKQGDIDKRAFYEMPVYDITRLSTKEAEKHGKPTRIEQRWVSMEDYKDPKKFAQYKKNYATAMAQGGADSRYNPSTWMDKMGKTIFYSEGDPQRQPKLLQKLALQREQKQLNVIRKDMMEQVRGAKSGQEALNIISSFTGKMKGTSYEADFLKLQSRWEKSFPSYASAKKPNVGKSSDAGFHNVGKGGTLGGVKLVSWKDAKKQSLGMI